MDFIAMVTWQQFGPIVELSIVIMEHPQMLTASASLDSYIDANSTEVSMVQIIGFI